MFKNTKHIKLFILTFALVLFSISTNAQRVRVIDNKGTFKTVNNIVATSNAAPTSPIEGDVWFDTLNAEIKIYDDQPTPLGTWRSFSDYYGKNIYNIDGALTSNRRLTGSSTHSLRFMQLSRFDVDNTEFINLNSKGFITLRAINGIDLLDSDVRITENLHVVGSYEDSNNNPGTAGQILSSTVTGTNWIDNTKNSVTTSSTAPTTPIENDVWFDTTDPLHTSTKIWDGSTWKLFSPTKAARIFYPPSIAIDASTTGTARTVNLYQQYVDQFGSPMAVSSGAPPTIPTYANTELYYYVTYYDSTVFDNVTVNATGVMTYDIKATPADYNSLINVVFVVK